MRSPHESRRKFLKNCAATGAAGLASHTLGLKPMFGLTPSGVASSSLAAQSGSSAAICGVFNAKYTWMLTQTGAQANRLILSPVRYGHTATFSDDPAENEVYKDLFHAWPQGVDLIVTLYWRKHKPLPDSDEFDTYAGYATSLIGGINALLPPGITVSVVALENEPFLQYLPSDLMLNSKGQSKAGQFFKCVAETLAKWRSNNGLNFGISTPAWTPEGSRTAQAAFKAWLSDELKNNDYITYFDFHAHVATISDLASYVNNISSMFGKLTVMCTEWSQERSFIPWLNSPIDACFAKHYSVPADVKTNLEYSESFEKVMQMKGSKVKQRGPTTLDQWNAWIATSGLDEKFISNAYKYFITNGVSIPCYGGALQYGSPTFNVDELYANMTVEPPSGGNYSPNYNFLYWYQQISGAASSGLVGGQPCGSEGS